MSNKALWAGRILSGAATLFLLFDAIIKILRINAATAGLAALGYDPNISLKIGLLLLACVILFMIPRTAFIGALLLTGYLGGAVASNVRIGAPLFGYILFPVYVAVFLWSGLYVTSARLRDLLRYKINS